MFNILFAGISKINQNLFEYNIFCCAATLYTMLFAVRCSLFAVRCSLSVRHTFSQSRMKVKVTGSSCINQLCHIAENRCVNRLFKSAV